MIIKKKLIIQRDNQVLEIRDGDNFQATFDMDSIGGTLSFELPYIEEDDVSTLNKPTFRADRLQKFDYVFLYYAELDSDREPLDEEYAKIFNGYIETVNLSKTKTEHRYTITCNSMLGLSAYTNVYGSEKVAFPGDEIALMPYKMLQRANLQMGRWQEFSTVEPRDIIPAENMDIQIDKIYGRLFSGNIGTKNCKEAIDIYRKKFGLIFTENMDGIVQVTSLVNYLYYNQNYEFKFAVPQPKQKTDEDIFERVTKSVLIGGANIFTATTNFTEKVIYATMLGISKLVDVFTMEKFKTTDQPSVYVDIAEKLYSLDKSLPANWVDQYEKSMSVAETTKKYLHTKGLMDLYKQVDPLLAKEKERVIENVLLFDINDNIFEIVYPEMTTEYDGVVVYGLESVGHAVDLTSMALKNIQPNADGGYSANMLKLYRRDLNEPMTLNKLAREHLYKLKQENKVKFKTNFWPYYRIGMPFTIVDNDRYFGKDLFICTKISYTLSKNSVECTIEGMTSILNGLPENVVTDKLLLLDVTSLQIDDKNRNTAWVNSWQ